MDKKKKCPFKEKSVIFKVEHMEDGMPYPYDTGKTYFICSLKGVFTSDWSGGKINKCIGEDKCPLIIN